ncbi:MAG: hypothetical protein QNJ34_16880 [Xenococcaceae cyanobacterium MO_188.B29]|nr:hypothetical protein [Xenococcaceae cyanobacterium MO_188.B29]
MANLNSLLIAFITGCFGMASGIFFLLYCLEEPIYSPVFKKKADGIDLDRQMRRVLITLQQLLTFRVPVVMVTLITCGILGSVFRVAFYGFAPLPILVILSSVLIFVTSASLVPPAIKIFKNANPKASFGEIQAALAPIVKLHRNVGIFVALTLILQLASTAF